jgi:hypothetical protein
MRECFSEALSQPSDKLSKLLFYNLENKSGNASLSAGAEKTASGTACEVQLRVACLPAIWIQAPCVL